MNKGRLIAFEGVDGSGKSTQIRLLAEVLEMEGRQVVLTREPSDGPHGRRIRGLLQNRAAMTREEELELFLADRRDHICRIIAPALAAGRIVLTDRYYLSTAAYQGAAGGNPEEILRVNEEFAPIPDLALLLRLAPEIGITRIKEYRREQLNDFEQEDYLARVAAIFDSLRRPYIRPVEASGGVAAVHAAILAVVREIM
ncbi:MAG: dTMP kinase [Thermodesulfobacteriota bacterium]